MGFASLKVNNSIFNITEENNKFELNTDNFDKFSPTDITPTHLQHKIIGPRVIHPYEKFGLEKSNTDGYLILYWAILDRHFEISKVISEFLLVWMKKKFNRS